MLCTRCRIKTYVWTGKLIQVLGSRLSKKKPRHALPGSGQVACSGTEDPGGSPTVGA